MAHERAYATRKGRTVADAQVYADDGISGADFLTRPGFPSRARRDPGRAHS